MADPTAFDLANPSTWIPSIVAGGLGLYVLARRFRSDSRNDKQERQIDEAVQLIITNLRSEVERLTERMTNMEAEIVRLHEDRTVLMHKLAEYQSLSQQSQLILGKG